MFRFSLLALVIFSLSSVQALELKDVKKKGLVYKSSKGPKYKADLESHALEKWEELEDFYNLFDDGMNHTALEQCAPDPMYDYLEANMDYPDLSVRYFSIKKAAGKRSIAYAVEPIATYSISYEYWKTEADNRNDKLSKVTIECPVVYEAYFYYEHTKSGKVKYLGSDLEE